MPIYPFCGVALLFFFTRQELNAFLTSKNISTHIFRVLLLLLVPPRLSQLYLFSHRNHVSFLKIYLFFPFTSSAGVALVAFPLCPEGIGVYTRRAFLATFSPSVTGPAWLSSRLLETSLLSGVHLLLPAKFEFSLPNHLTICPGMLFGLGVCPLFSLPHALSSLTSVNRDTSCLGTSIGSQFNICYGKLLDCYEEKFKISERSDWKEITIQKDKWETIWLCRCRLGQVYHRQRHFCIEYIFILLGETVSWESKKQLRPNISSLSKLPKKSFTSEAFSQSWDLTFFLKAHPTHWDETVMHCHNIVF